MATHRPTAHHSELTPESQPARPDDSPAQLHWAELITEGRHPASLELDRMTPDAAVALLLDEDRRGLELARLHTVAIAQAATWVAETLRADGDLVLVGAGTSGRLAVLEAAECPPTFGTDPQRIRAVMAGGNDAVFAAREGAEDQFDLGIDAAGTLSPSDLLIGVSASAVTPFVRGALTTAKHRGARTILLTCARAADAADSADLVLALATGPEILTGSTRLKAGSATKAVLNAITTVAMIELGKVYQNWMVDLRQGSAKLRDRARRIVAAAGQVDAATADQLLAAAGGEVKVAVAMALTGLAAAPARQRLRDAGGQLWRLAPPPAD